MDPLTLFHKRIQQYDSLLPDFRIHLSRNPNITLDMVLQDIQRNPSKKDQWNFQHLAEHIPVKDLIPYITSPTSTSTLTMYQYDHISLYGKIDIPTLLKHPSFPWNWCGVSWNKHITMDDMAAHPDLPWDYDMIPNNPNYKLHPLVIEHEKPATFYKLSKIATLEQLEEYPNKPWTNACLSSPYIQDKIKLKELFRKNTTATTSTTATHHDEEDLSPYFIAWNPNLNFQDLQELFGSHRKFFYYASLNPNITVQDFLAYPDEHWVFESLSTTLPVEFMVAHPEYKWYWHNVLYYNKTITYDKLTKSFDTSVGDSNYRYYLVRVNKHISWYDRKCIFEDLLKKPYHPEFISLVSLPLFLEPTFKEIRRYIAKKQIVRHVVKYITNPEYHQCRKRLRREHKVLT